MTSHTDDPGAPAVAASVRLADLVSEFDLTVHEIASADLTRTVTLVTDDSRTVAPGAVFVVRRGLAVDGMRYIPNAIRAGAVAVLVDAA
ncbi:MAG: Mur ligase domain-containing protein, partial [Planctomycetota bacterium]